MNEIIDFISGGNIDKIETLYNKYIYIYIYTAQTLMKYIQHIRYYRREKSQMRKIFKF